MDEGIVTNAKFLNLIAVLSMLFFQSADTVLKAKGYDVCRVLSNGSRKKI